MYNHTVLPSNPTLEQQNNYGRISLQSEPLAEVTRRTRSCGALGPYIKYSRSGTTPIALSNKSAENFIYDNQINNYAADNIVLFFSLLQIIVLSWNYISITFTSL